MSNNIERLNVKDDWMELLHKRHGPIDFSFNSNIITAKIKKTIIGTYNETTHEGLIYEHRAG